MANVSICRLSTLEQAQQTEALNCANMPERLSTDVDGFITAHYSVEQLLRMSTVCAPILAVHDGKVVGFLIVLHAEVANALPELAPVIVPVSQKIYKGLPVSSYRYLRCGPVCVDHRYRHQHIAQRLYQFAIDAHPSDFLIVLINERNQASIRAHESLGFTEFLVETEDGITWHYFTREL